MEQEHDQPFQALFSELRRADQGTAPSFAEQWQAATRHAAAPAPSRARLGAMSVALLVAIVGVLAVALMPGRADRREQARVKPLPASTAASWVYDSPLSQWQSPTD